ncbi:MAG: trypsin-like peptidase domain-containing protein [Candidatus Nealsonbacteria bacterium]|nr:trypsin-like peptidase domain-containing protein [Candidatus Nealsonbacteria bacterium]
MSFYQQRNLPKINIPKFRLHKGFGTIALSVIFSSVFGFLAGGLATGLFLPDLKPVPPPVSHEQKIIEAVEKASPSVVSIIVSKDLPIFEEYYISPFGGDPFFQFRIPQQRQIGTKKQEIGGGTGFIVSADGMVLTNKHVVLDEEAEYTVFTNDGKKFEAKVLARDPVQDLAILKIETVKEVNDRGEMTESFFPVMELGDSDGLQMGQTVVAIGNALGEFKNTVSVGVVSGLGRTITASGGSFVETIEDVIQTDAAINKGNSGGPLLDLNGKVVGINTATVLDAQSIGFAIPVSKAKRDIRQIQEIGEIIYPFLGVHYIMLTPELQEENNLFVSEGAWINSDNEESAIVANSAAEKAGLKDGDIIIELQDQKLTLEKTLASVLQEYGPNDEVVMIILRGEEKISLQVTLGKRE